jgi:ribosomal 50S subunit-recycling heat shock protein
MTTESTDHSWFHAFEASRLRKKLEHAEHAVRASDVHVEKQRAKLATETRDYQRFVAGYANVSDPAQVQSLLEHRREEHKQRRAVIEQEIQRLDGQRVEAIATRDEIQASAVEHERLATLAREQNFAGELPALKFAEAAHAEAAQKSKDLNEKLECAHKAVVDAEEKFRSDDGPKTFASYEKAGSAEKLAELRAKHATEDLKKCEDSLNAARTALATAERDSAAWAAHEENLCRVVATTVGAIVELERELAAEFRVLDEELERALQAGQVARAMGADVKTMSHEFVRVLARDAIAQSRRQRGESADPVLLVSWQAFPIATQTRQPQPLKAAVGDG